MTKLYVPLTILLLLLTTTILDANPTWITLENGRKALQYLPEEFTPKKRYPLIIALHGMQESPTSSLKAWKKVADEEDMILVCPWGSNHYEAYTRTPTDDRKVIVQFRDLMDKTYNIDFSKSLLVGFSRGGNFAYETGLLYPNKFKNVLVFFGFFNNLNTKILEKNKNRYMYKQSNFYILTGQNDLTLNSAKFAESTLKKHQIKTWLNVHKNLIHAYPKDLPREIIKVQNWIRNKKTRKNKYKGV